MELRLKPFLNEPVDFSPPEQARYAVIPARFDKTSSWQKGADKGPNAILKAAYYLELFDLETNSEVFRRGIAVVDNPLDLETSESMLEDLKRQVSLCLQAGCFPVVIGGEHSVSYAPVAVLKNHYPQLSVLQLDAHTDLRDSYLGSRWNHGCVMRRIQELCPITQVGIRSLDSSELESVDQARFFPAEKIYDNKAWMTQALDTLSPQVYITIDLDVFDPAIMPSTGTPEPGGLSFYPVLEFLKLVLQKKTCVGFDLVELCPGPNPHPDFLAAKLLYKILSYHNKYGR